MTITIYHNPRCSRSRRTLELLRERGLKPRILEYLKTPSGYRNAGTSAEYVGSGAA